MQKYEADFNNTFEFKLLMILSFFPKKFIICYYVV